MKMKLKPMQKVLFAVLVLVLATLACGGPTPSEYEIGFADGSTTTITAYSCFSKTSAGSVMVYCFTQQGLSDPDVTFSAVSFRKK